jgi:nucleoside-diphosphate-sugar epimerase
MEIIHSTIIGGFFRMKALVTGANGFVGSHLTEYLATHGYEVTALILKGTDTFLLSQLHPSLRNVTIVEGNILDINCLNTLIKSVDFVFHLAGVIRGYTQQDYDRINLNGTQKVIQSCCEINPNVKRLVIISSMVATFTGTLENPSCEDEPGLPIPRDFYGVSKFKLERFAKSCFDKLPISIVRPCPVFGPGDMVSLGLFKAVKIGIKFSYPGKERHFNFIDVEDLIRAIYLCSIRKEAVGEIFHIAGDGIITWEDLQELIGHLIFGKRYGSLIGIPIPDFLYHIIAFVTEAIYKLFRKPAPFYNKSKAHNATLSSNVCSTKKAKQLLGWKPEHNYVSLVKRAGSWYKAQGLI